MTEYPQHRPVTMARHGVVAAPHYLEVIPDDSITNARRILVCSGKIGHNLRIERERRKENSVAIVFLEQLYPWPEREMQAALDQHSEAKDIGWAQEEPANMGAWSFVRAAWAEHVPQMPLHCVVVFP